MAVAIPIMMLAGAAISAYGQVQQANAAKEAGHYNAKLQERNAVIATQQANQEATLLNRRASAVQGSLQAGYGAAGVTNEGSPSDVLAASVTNAKLDEATILYKGQLKAMGYHENATLNMMGANTAEKQGGLNAASEILTGVARSGSTYASMNSRYGTLRRGPAGSSYDDAGVY